MALIFINWNIFLCPVMTFQISSLNWSDKISDEFTELVWNLVISILFGNCLHKLAYFFHVLSRKPNWFIFNRIHRAYFQTNFPELVCWWKCVWLFSRQEMEKISTIRRLLPNKIIKMKNRNQIATIILLIPNRKSHISKHNDVGNGHLLSMQDHPE